jgi:hypothetical protein
VAAVLPILCKIDPELVSLSLYVGVLKSCVEALVTLQASGRGLALTTAGMFKRVASRAIHRIACS